MTAPILIVGAGPTGLVLALRLRRHGTPFRIVDAHAGPGEASRALVVHARTLEFYQQLGLADQVVAAGARMDAVHMREHGTEVGSFSLQDMGEGLSPYPFALGLPQDEHERLLVDALVQEGVAVEWGTRLDHLHQDADGVDVVLSRERQQEQARFAWVAGCDGAHSQVRASMGAVMEGGTYDRLYYVADVALRAPAPPGLTVALDKGELGLMLPARRGQSQRLIGYVPQDQEGSPSFGGVRADAERLMGVQVEGVHWFSTYRVHHRVASRFQDGRCFLLGDAGHLHSPVGGQGMNTGIGDAVNLSWKLADVVAGRAGPALLDTYAPERIAFARQLVATTDRAFQVVTNPGLLGTVVRTWVMPHVMPAAMGFAPPRHAMFRTLSQIRIAYGDSALSEGKAGHIEGGDRLPWVPGTDNFAPLASLQWQVHGFGELPAPFQEAATALGLPVHAFAWSGGAEQAGFRRGAAYLVRPDGHVALAMTQPDGARLRDYAGRFGLQFGNAMAGVAPGLGTTVTRELKRNAERERIA